MIAAGLCALAVRRHLARRDTETRRARAAIDAGVVSVAEQLLQDDHKKHLHRANHHALLASAAHERARDRVKQLQALGAPNLAELVKRWNG